MGDDNMQLIEKMIENTVDDVKELKNDFRELKREVDGIHRKQSVTDNTVQQFTVMFTNLDTQIRELREDWKADKQEERKRLWGFAVTIIVAMTLVQLGLK